MIDCSQFGENIELIAALGYAAIPPILIGLTPTFLAHPSVSSRYDGYPDRILQNVDTGSWDKNLVTVSVSNPIS